MKSTTLYYKEGSSDKVYQATIQPQGSLFIVNFAYGRRGSTLNTGTKTQTPVSLDLAERIFEKLIKEKQAKGYTEGENGTPYSTLAETKEYSGIQPQLLNPIDETELERYVRNPDWVLQEKFDGKRLLLLKQGIAVSGINRKGLFVGIPATIHQEAQQIAGDFLLDGECIGDDYHVFDILQRRGRDVRSSSYRSRLMLLINELGAARLEYISRVENLTGEKEKRRFIQTATIVQKEGVVFKYLDAPYTPGRPNSGGTQFKHKFYATASFIVAGINQSKRSIRLALVDGHEQQEAGNVTIPPNHGIPEAGAVVEVRYLYAFRESGSVYQPVYLGKREDVLPQECTTKQLKYKSADEDTD